MSDMTPTQKFAQSMRAIRKSRGLSAQQLSDLPGFPLSRGGISKLENIPGHPVRLDEAAKIADTLGFSLGQMIDGSAPHYDGLPEIVADLVGRLDAITNAHK